MKNELGIKVDELGIKVCCENCCGCTFRQSDLSAKCTESGGFAFEPNRQALITRLRYLQKLRREEIDALEEGVSALRTYYEERIKELKEQQFTKEEAEKVETFLTHPEKQDSSKVMPLVPKWEVWGDNDCILRIPISQQDALQFIVRSFKDNKYICEVGISISEAEEIGTFNTLEEAKAKVNECIRELGETLVYFANNIKTEE